MMTLTQAQKDRFAQRQTVNAALTVSDLEASNWTLIAQWNDDWEIYVKDGTTPPGTDRPPDKPAHP